MDTGRSKAARLDSCLRKLRRENPGFQKQMERIATDYKMQDLKTVLEISESIGWEAGCLASARNQADIDYSEKRIRKLRKRLRKAVSEV